CSVLGGTALLASDAFERVTVFTRRPIDITGTNSDKLESDFAGHTHAFSCLGASRWKNGSDGFYKVDHDYMLNAATACKKVQVENYSICSTKGADKTHASYMPGLKARSTTKIFSYLLPVSAAVSSSTIAWSMVFNALKPSETSRSVIFENSDMVNTFENNQ
ncbi:hypothetical protein BX661DRAFT_188395, partial [Kickxella alabastrina]|uniref:uncharacterized protein n=1 Tax=Kickxella alabastrina TaxID=61397 RepID=UPI00221EFF0B